MTNSMKKISRFGLNASAASVALGIVFAASPVFAQTVAPAADAAAAADDTVIIVTGSRLPQANLTGTAPVTIVSAADLKLQGTTRVEDMLNSLPQAFASQASTLSNGSTGTATVNLRNLGDRRTLVLVNGRRLLPGDPTDSAADLNAIPSSLVKRVDVLTGGASSTYGADAVAGVVNFIMDTDFTGIQMDGQYSLYQHDNNSNILRAQNQAQINAGAVGFGYPNGSVADGGTVDATLTIGGGFDDDKGHIVGYFGYRKVRPVLQGRRDYSSCTPQANAAGTLTCGGSATSANGNVIAYADGTSTFFNVGPNRTLPPGLTRYNFAPANYYQRPDERYTGGFFAHYDISDAIKPYAEFMFMDDRTVAQIAPSGDFGNTLTINCDNPLLGSGQKAVLCAQENLVNGFLGNYPLTADSNPNPAAPINFIDPTTGLPYNKGYAQVLRRNVEGGPRLADLEHTEYRGVIGTKGDLGKGWSYDAYYQYGRTVYAQTYSNEFSVSRLTKALDAVPGPNGTVVCRSALDKSDPACVPYDLFGGTPSAASLAYVQATGFQRGTVSEQVASASLTGLLGEYGLKTPWATDGVSINIGAEYRKESLDLNTDNEFSTGDLTGQGGATLPIKGSFDVKEIFGEARLPVVQDGFIKNLSFEGGYRYSHYSLAGGGGYNTNTYKVAGEFAPIADISFRAGYNRAVRAPNLQELFATQHVALDGATDPCAGSIKNGTVNGLTAAQCAFTGVTAAQFGNVAENPASQYNGLIGGKSTLQPEISDTKTFGVVLQPSFIRHLAITVDYFDIKIKKPIQEFGADTILATCAANGSPTICSLVHRNPVNGSLWLTPDGYVTDLQSNVGSLKTKGIDVNASYGMDIGKFGGLNFTMVGTYLDKFVTDNGISTPYDCAGYFGAQCGTPAPKWRHKARVTWNAPEGFSLSFQWRYFEKVKVDASSSNPTLKAAYSPFGATIPAQSYFDLSGTVKLGDNYTFRAGVQNLFDKDPPLINSNGSLSNCGAVYCNGGTYPAVYDALGRYIYASVQLNF